MPSKPWQLAEWRKRREARLKQLAEQGQDKCVWCGSREHPVLHHPAKPNTLTDEEYLSLEGTIRLCRRCNLAHHKGMVLCRECKKRYHKRRYPMCWECWKKSSLSLKGAERYERKPYTHPWCGKVFMIQGRWWDIEAEPQMCCIERCDRDVNNCDIALKRWDETSDDV